MEQWQERRLLNAKIDEHKDGMWKTSATNEQVERFVDWIIENVPQAHLLPKENMGFYRKKFQRSDKKMIRGAYTEWMAKLSMPRRWLNGLESAKAILAMWLT